MNESHPRVRSSHPASVSMAPARDEAARRQPARSRSPAATYRLQLGPGFGFDDATGLLEYLERLGIDWVYLSPVFAARQSSEHGYDVVDPNRIREELGGDAAWQRLLHALERRSMSLLLDIVPNHMAADAANPWWWDVLRHGRSSAHACVFDIDWEAGGDRVVLPVLEGPVAEAVARGELRLARGSPYDDAEPVVLYRDRPFPLAPGSPPNTIETLLDEQHYRLLEWREGLRRINYRRFFDIADLIGVRVEDAKVFEATHALILRLARDAVVAGLRVDHVDGLRDPGAYLDRLRRACVDPAGQSAEPILLVEKILASDEELPAWPVDGTTGYEFLGAATRLFLDPRGAACLRADVARRTATPDDFDLVRRRAKRQVLESLLTAELDRLVACLVAIDRERGGSTPQGALRRALVETTAALDVYRTYGTRPATSQERTRLEAALRVARETLLPGSGDGSTDEAHEAALATLERALLGGTDTLDRPAAARLEDFVARWQQLSGAAMAKGHEDTALYRDVAILALDEVGAEPVAPHDAVAAFHKLCARRARRSPLSLNATATHDTKRGEDTRARLAVLTELAAPWTAALDRWFAWHRPLRSEVASGPAPTATDELLCYQTLLAIWPAGTEPTPALAERMVEYLRKALREEKARTGWHTRDEAYEEAVGAFATQLALGAGGARFRADSAELRSTMAFQGAIASLAQLVLKTMAPGVPDLYQGTELWQLALVDPDNRRLPDFERRRRLLDETGAAAEAQRDWGALRSSWRNGAIKLAMTRRLLALRHAAPRLFAAGEYLALDARGDPAARHLVVFARRLGDAMALVLVPRLTTGLTGGRNWPVGTAVWGECTVPWPGPAVATEWLTGRELGASGGRLRVAELLDELPFAVVVTGRGTPAAASR